MRSEAVPQNRALSASQPQPLFIGIQEVARMLGIPESSVREGNDDGRIPRSVFIEGFERWRVKELRSWAPARRPHRTT